MALTASDLAYVRSEVGSDEPPTDADLSATYDQLTGTLDSRDPRAAVNATIVHWLEQKLSDLLDGPTSFSVPGQYSENNSETMRLLERKIARFRSTPDGVQVTRIRRSDRSRSWPRRRQYVDDHILP